MKKFVKISVIVFCAAIVLGLLTGGIAYAAGGSYLFQKDGDFTPETANFVAEGVTEIKYTAPSGSLEILRSDTEEIKVDWYESEYSLVTVTVENGVLKIEREEKRDWEFLVMNFTRVKMRLITVYLPLSFTGDIDMASANGYIEIERGGELNNIKFKSSNGKAVIRNTAVNVFDGNTSNGGIIFENVTANEVKFDTSNGVLDFKNVTVGTVGFGSSNGAVKFNGAITGTKQSVFDTSNGSIELNLQGDPDDYRIDFKTSNASINIDSMSFVKEGEYNKNGAVYIKLGTSNGHITVNFS
ncbi:MAG: DUF4097 domain-containing protein [Christensenellaceae bacterium]|jgi:hypothetical protein|nr:DUF4097 domain-containing protein [Christensenellaceae bacterium]